MIIKKEGKEFITIDTDRKDAIFLLNCINLGLNSIQLNKEDVTRYISFLQHLKEVVDK